MTREGLLRDAHFEEVAEARVDSKHRITLKRVTGTSITSYRVYRNSVGQIVLDPMVTIPAHEAWLFRNKKAAHMVREGLEDARHKRLVKAKEDYTKYLHDKT